MVELDIIKQEVVSMMYQALRLTVVGVKQFIGLTKGYPAKEKALAAIEEQRDYEKTFPPGVHKTEKFFIRTYQLISEEEI